MLSAARQTIHVVISAPVLFNPERYMLSFLHLYYLTLNDTCHFCTCII